MLSIVVTMGNNNVIGKEGQAIWHLAEDWERFRKLTDGKTLIMGRITFESLKEILPNRKYVVLCSNGKLKVNNPNVKVVTGTYELEEYVDSEEECFVIGGGIVYRILMPHAQKMYITKIDHDFNGDIFFPEIDESKWKIADREKGTKNEENPYDYEYITYVKK